MNAERIISLAIVLGVIVGVCSQGGGLKKRPYCYPKCIDRDENCITLARCPFKVQTKCNRCATKDSMMCPKGQGGSGSGNYKQLLMLVSELLKNQYKRSYAPTTPAPGNDLFGFGGGKGRRGGANDMMTMFAVSSMF